MEDALNTPSTLREALARLSGRRRVHVWRSHARGTVGVTRARSQGVSAIETLLAAPIVLLLGLAVLQWALVFHGHTAVLRAATEGARAGSVDHALAEAIERGLARGLAPWLHGSSDPADHLANLALTRAHLAAGKAAGWVSWRQLSPTQESFSDWAEPARDADGELVIGLLEIPNDNLTMRAQSMSPTSGSVASRGSEPIGAASGQTLADANLLKIEFIYGVPVSVPIIGRVAAWVMRSVDGCRVGGARVLGAVNLGVPAPSANPRAWACAYYDAIDETGALRPRWPVRVSATVRMQSPARSAAQAAAGQTAPLVGGALGAGHVDDASLFEPVAVSSLNPRGASAGEDGSVDRGSGFLRIGADRFLPDAGACGG